jgi:hypothetical protein
LGRGNVALWRKSWVSIKLIDSRPIFMGSPWPSRVRIGFFPLAALPCSRPIQVALLELWQSRKEYRYGDCFWKPQH